ncbi:MAG: primosomal protein N' [Gammaproteobacteria bacterium]
MNSPAIVTVALPVPLYQRFEYLPAKGQKSNAYKIGTRVWVPFGNRKLVGLVVDNTQKSSLAINKLKFITESLDEEPILDKKLLALLFWAAEYYQQPLGEVLFTALPSVLRKGKLITPASNTLYKLVGKQIFEKELKRAPKQLAIVELLRNHPNGLSADDISKHIPTWRSAIKALLNKSLVEKIQQEIPIESLSIETSVKKLNLNTEQQIAYEEIKTKLNDFYCCLLDGVTGSGKTEVYLSLAKNVLDNDKQVLILAPEIGLTPQLLQRIENRLGEKVHLMHSGLNENQRAQTWLAAKTSKANIIVGTRSAIFLPFAKLGLIIIDEEHDLSFKQHEGFLYNARDIAVYRAKQLKIPILLGTATPSFETQHNVNNERYQKLVLSKRAKDSSFPDVKLIDMRSKKSSDGLSNELIQAIQAELDSDNQILLFLNRRGYAPTILCQECAWVAECSRCDARMTFYKNRNILKCHHCLKEERVPEYCPTCNSDKFLWLGEGTQRIENTLTEIFPNTSITRIDRDSTRKKDALKEKLDDIRAGKYQIIIGTQMLSKGHDFPNVTLVGILNVDHGLFSTDFRATERLAQLLVQVSGRAGRSTKKGKVLLQTYLPEHPLLNCLLSQGYAAFSKEALKIRKECALPPYTFMLMIRARANSMPMTQNFLQDVKNIIQKDKIQGMTIYGPIPALMERKAGMYQCQLIIFTQHRKSIQNNLKGWAQIITQRPLAKRVRWDIEVDPLETN